MSELRKCFTYIGDIHPQLPHFVHLTNMQSLFRLHRALPLKVFASNIFIEK